MDFLNRKISLSLNKQLENETITNSSFSHNGLVGTWWDFVDYGDPSEEWGKYANGIRTSWLNTSDEVWKEFVKGVKHNHRGGIISTPKHFTK